LNGIAIFCSSISSSSSLDFGCIIFDPTLLFKASGYIKYKIYKYRYKVKQNTEADSKEVKSSIAREAMTKKKVNKKISF